MRQQGLLGSALDQAASKKVADGLRDQIDQLLLVQKGKDLNINVDADVNRRIAEIQSQKARSPIPISFTNGCSSRRGTTFEDFKLQMKNSLLSQRVIQQKEVYPQRQHSQG